ncbi:MAG: hypothetical protein A4E74_01551 [Syntrophus sp. PtaB.Bin075]|nr:MAG: hypothetical protein A4E74_01551 [Syntrophus sp. PtaB.Bin075]
MWGIFECDDSVHVIPCDDEGIVLSPHAISDFCLCRPEAAEFGADGRIIVVHHEVH